MVTAVEDGSGAGGMRDGGRIQRLGLRSRVPLRSRMLLTSSLQLGRQRVRTSRAMVLRFGIKHRCDVSSLQMRLLRHPVVERLSVCTRATREGGARVAFMAQHCAGIRAVRYLNDGIYVSRSGVLYGSETRSQVAPERAPRGMQSRSADRPRVQGRA